MKLFWTIVAAILVTDAIKSLIALAIGVIAALKD
jgi:hypothetical protein